MLLHCSGGHADPRADLLVEVISQRLPGDAGDDQDGGRYSAARCWGSIVLPGWPASLWSKSRIIAMPVNDLVTEATW